MKTLHCKKWKRKVDYMKKNGILLDDYGKNCREWNTKKDNFSIKVVKPLEVITTVNPLNKAIFIYGVVLSSFVV